LRVASTCGQRYSPTWTTTCGSLRRKSSVRCWSSSFEDENDAVRIANDSPYGLGGGVWTADREHGLELARRIRTGTVTVNGANPGFDGPFGGYKTSGIGREFGAVGLTQYVEHKTIAV
jgi:acyl-CoA reductase-like NAD-dependent aldehyde dehydrogenase